MPKIRLYIEKQSHSFIYQSTPLQKALYQKQFDVIVYLIEKGADFKFELRAELLVSRTNVSLLLFNFFDTYYQRFFRPDRIKKARFSMLIENGMI